MINPEHACTFDPEFLRKAADVQNCAAEAQKAQIKEQFATLASDHTHQQHRHDALPFPPGFVGALAQFVYKQAPLPVPEVAVVAALGLMAGLCGKAWHIPGSGLNLYIVLVARSAIGKEAMHTGISKIIGAAIRSFPQFANFVDFNDYASGPALIKACAGNTSFVNVAGEIGHKFLEMADAKSGSPMRNYRKQLTTLYSKSGPDGIAGGIWMTASVAIPSGFHFRHKPSPC